MSDEIRGRNDMLEPEVSRPSPLPPAAKTSREVSHGIRDIALPLMALLAAKWGLVDGYVFAGALFLVLGGNMALRRGEGSIDMQGLAALLKR